MTPTRPDDLKPGIMIAVVGYKGERPARDNGPFGPPTTEPLPSFNGHPYKILSMSLPFLCVTDGKGCHAIDLREWDVRKVSGRYAKSMGYREHGHRRPQSEHRQPDQNRCPRCGERMRQMMVAGQPGWFLACPNCGYNGGGLVAVD